MRHEYPEHHTTAEESAKMTLSRVINSIPGSTSAKVTSSSVRCAIFALSGALTALKCDNKQVVAGVTAVLGFCWATRPRTCAISSLTC